MSRKSAEPQKPSVVQDGWIRLRQVTKARIALGRAGGSLPTAPLLDFQLAHARARDAVHLEFDAGGLQRQLEEQSYSVLRVHSAAGDRISYLQRPDLGRRLDEWSRETLREWLQACGENCYDAAFVIADGLSALAVHEHAAAVLTLAARELTREGWRLTPVVVAEQSRVALGDEIGALLGAEQVAILLGERPGLSSADSLGIYLTYAPRVGRTDGERNCISNIHGGGLTHEEAAGKLVYLMKEARRLQMSGVALRDDSDKRSPVGIEA
jgi:ethanolamine ammonia-lyase small subunit